MFEYNDIIELISIAYKKLKASVNFDKTQAFLRHKIVVEEEFAGEEEKHVLRISKAISDLINQYDEEWEKLSNMILEGISIHSFPKSIVDESKSIIFNKKSKKNKVKVEKWQHFIDMPLEGHILGVVWTMFVGKALDSSPSMYEHAYANRLLKDLEHKNSPKLFQPYFTQYESWREHALSEAKRCLKEKQDAIIITMDLTRYFYSVDMTETDFAQIYDEYKDYTKNENDTIEGVDKVDAEIFLEKINNLVYRICVKFSEILRQSGDMDFTDGINTMLPIGFMPSMILSNWKLRGFDKAIITRINPVYYGRYVDDIIMVDKVEKISDLYAQSEADVLEQDKVMDYFFVKCSCDKTSNRKQHKAILYSKTKKDENGKKYKQYYIDSKVMPGNSRISLQGPKVKVFYFKESAASALIDCFKKQIAKNASGFKFMPDVDCLFDDNDFGEFFKLINKESLNKFRGIEKFEFDKYGASKALGKLLKVTGFVSDKKELKLIKGILNMFDPQLFIDNYSLWERIFEILIVNGQYDTLLDTIKDIFEIIENQMCGKDGTKEGIISKGKECLKKYLLISAYRPIALLGESDIKNLMTNIFNIFNIKNQYMPIIRSYRKTRMFNKYLMPIFIEFIDDSNELKCLYNFDEVVNALKKSVNELNDAIDDIRFYKYLPFTVTPQEISFALKCCELEKGNGILGKQEYGKLILELYKKINHFGSGDESFDKFFKPSKIDNGGNIFIDITDKSFNNDKGIFKIAIGNAKIDYKRIEKLFRGEKHLTYNRYQEIIQLVNLSIKEKTDILVLPECYVPFEWIPMLANICARNQIALVTGIEYYLTKTGTSINRQVYNLTGVILPYKWKDYSYASITFHHKCHYAPNEIELIEGFNQRYEQGNGYELYRWKGVYFPVYCCYELASIKDRSIFANMLDILIAVEWNKDINYYSNIIESLSRDLHCYCVQVNSSDFGDSRIVQPTKTETLNIVKTKGGVNTTILVGEVDVKKLRSFQQKSIMSQKDDATFKQTPPGFSVNSPYLRNKKDSVNLVNQKNLEDK